MAKDAMDLFRGLPEDAQKRARLKAGEIVLSNRLARLRRRLGLTQSELAEKLNVKQAAVSRMEGRSDIKVSNMVRYLEALGAENIRILADIGGRRSRIQLTR